MEDNFLFEVKPLELITSLIHWSGRK